jgi:hypothetical protein
MAIGAPGVAAQRPGYPLHADLTSLRAVLPAAQEPERHAPQVARWAFDADLGHITGVDAHGRVLMSVGWRRRSAQRRHGKRPWRLSMGARPCPAEPPASGLDAWRLASAGMTVALLRCSAFKEPP